MKKKNTSVLLLRLEAELAQLRKEIESRKNELTKTEYKEFMQRIRIHQGCIILAKEGF